MLRAGADLWPDRDSDGDVDQDDFARWQLCYTGPDSQDPPAEGCQVLDRDEDDDVDATDLSAFENCATGPMVPLSPGTLAAGCEL